MFAKPLVLKSSNANIKKELLIKGPLHIGIILVIVLIYQVLFAGDEILTSIGLYFLALLIFWFIQLFIVIPISKNEIVIDNKGIICAKIKHFELNGFIAWSQIANLDINYGHRSPTILIDIHPRPSAIKQHLEASKEEPDAKYADKIRLRINFIDQTDEDIKAYVEEMGKVNHS